MVTVTQWALHANWQRPKPERKQAREETLSHCGPLRILIKAQNKIQSAPIFFFKILIEYISVGCIFAVTPIVERIGEVLESSLDFTKFLDVIWPCIYMHSNKIWKEKVK